MAFFFRPKLVDALKGYTREQLGTDIASGLTVGVVALPLAMAFAIASGLKPEAGLFTAIIAGFLISALGGSLVQIGGPGFIEGGDILVTEREILVGRSARTNAAGIAELTRLVAPWGHKVREVITPPGVLHFKTDCSLLDGETILSTKRLDASGCFEGYRVIHVAEGEEACANTIRFNDLVIMPAGFPRTRDLLAQAGYKVQEIGNSECAKLDGGMSCLSLRFTPRA